MLLLFVILLFLPIRNTEHSFMLFHIYRASVLQMPLRLSFLSTSAYALTSCLDDSCIVPLALTDSLALCRLLLDDSCLPSLACRLLLDDSCLPTLA
ncbi:hypothetical protein Tco_0626477 [Tanacetum coccineum]|uniref:Secreted protein n=1 Tax=Tanacetum coccineum TaxID=301880 RepID=A0ABQ4WJQ9_9ASTR